MKGLLLAVLLVGLLVGGDRLAERAAEGAIARQAQSSGALSQRPDADVGGALFLPQALAGRYHDVRLTTSGAVGGFPTERLDVSLRGVRVPLGDVVRRSVQRVPVDAVRGTVLLSFDELSRRAGHGVTVRPAGDRLRLEGSVEVLGRTVTAAATSSVRVDGDRVRVRAQEVSTGSEVADRLVNAAAADRFDFSIRLGQLPYALQLTGVRVQPDGVALTADSGATVLSR